VQVQAEVQAATAAGQQGAATNGREQEAAAPPPKAAPPLSAAAMRDAQVQSVYKLLSKLWSLGKDDGKKLGFKQTGMMHETSAEARAQQCSLAPTPAFCQQVCHMLLTYAAATAGGAVYQHTHVHKHQLQAAQARQGGWAAGRLHLATSLALAPHGSLCYVQGALPAHQTRQVVCAMS
jgi:hypothetical protein